MINKIYKKFKIIFTIEKPEKVRIRTSEELEIRKYEFLKICEILDKLKIKYFLQGGILLGAIRNSGFIPWDWDAEISVFSDDVINKIDHLISEIKSSGFKIEKYSKELYNLKIDFAGELPKETTSYTILGWTHNKEKNIYWRNNFKIPDNFFENMKKIKLFDKYFFAPNPPEKYLEHQYGNWKLPLQTSDKSLYLTRKFSGISLFETIIKKIMRLTYFKK